MVLSFSQRKKRLSVVKTYSPVVNKLNRKPLRQLPFESLEVSECMLSSFLPNHVYWKQNTLITVIFHSFIYILIVNLTNIKFISCISSVFLRGLLFLERVPSNTYFVWK